jgi:hypothetical protein
MNSEAMVFLTSAVGVFYVLAACLVLRRAYADGGLAPAAGRPEQLRTVLMGLSAAHYAAAGIALLFRSGVAVWLLAGGLGLQALAYGLAFALSGSSAADAGGRQWNQALTGGMISAAAIAFSAYAWRAGVLT